MAKKSLVIRDFSSGLRGTGHGADLPNNALVGGYNHNVYRNAGLIEPSGKWISAHILHSLNNNMTDWISPPGHVSMRGRGLFYFTSDYDNFKTIPDTLYEHPVSSPNTSVIETGNWNDPGDPKDDGNYLLGEKGNLNSCEYFILGSRRAVDSIAANNDATTWYPGENGMVLHVYQIRRNLWSSEDGTYNGWVVDIPMGIPGFYDGTVSEYTTQPQVGSEHENIYYSTGWFPVYYYARGAVRVCDGGFLEKNSSKLWIGYHKDQKMFSPIYDTANDSDDLNIEADATGWANSYEHPQFEVDQWVIDKGSAYAPGLLCSPKFKGFYIQQDEYGYNISGGLSGQKNIFQKIDTGSKNKIIFVHARNSDDDLFDGKSFSNLENLIYGSNDFKNTFGPAALTEANGMDGLLFVGLSVQNSESLNAYHNWNDDDDEAEFYNSLEGNINLYKTGVSNISGIRNTAIWATYLYDTGEESTPSVIKRFTRHDNQTWFYTAKEISDLIYGDNLFFKLHAFVNPMAKKAHPRIQGARIYMSSVFSTGEIANKDKSELSFVGEVNFKHGIRGAGQADFNIWQYNNATSYTPYSMPPWYYGHSNYIPSLGTETFRTFHGYDWSDIKPCYYKTAVTVNNRVYAGNVKFNNILYPDRMMKTQVGEFDTWTEQGFIDVSVDDGESIVHLEAFGDRILQFKENTLHIINIEKQFEYLEISVKHAGIKSPSQVVSTEVGVFWVNKKGIFVYNGQTVKNLLGSSDLSIMSGPVTLDVAEKPVVPLGDWESLISEESGYEPILSYDPHSKEIIIQGQSTVDFGFIWNLEKGVLTQTFNKGSNSANGIKSNSIITINGEAMYFEGTQWDHAIAQNDPGDIVVRGQMRKWDSDPQVLNGRNLFLLTKAIDFGNHARRKVVQSISFTYKSDGLSRLLPYVNIWYLDGNSPSTFYLCDDTAVAGDVTTVQIVSDTNTHLQLPDTSSKFETFTYKRISETGVGIKSLRSVAKNIGAIQIGLLKNATSNDTDADFELEEISITYRDKKVK